MLKKPGMILLGIGISILLSSCHIKQNDVETIASNTPFLRVYQPNDFIEYNVTAVAGTSLATSLGTLRVQWDPTSELIDPFDGFTQYPVLKETTTLTYNPDPDSLGSETDETIIRFISQDDNGSITLYAIDDGIGRYWLYDPSYPDLSSNNFVRPVIFDSPMAIGSPTNSSVNFSVMEGCAVITPGICAPEIYTLNDNLNIVGDTTPVTTNLGKFSNPFEITLSGGTLPRTASAISFWAGTLNACGNSRDTITHSATMFVMPEIGMIRMRNICQNISTGNDVTYIITLKNTNIPLP